MPWPDDALPDHGLDIHVDQTSVETNVREGHYFLILPVEMEKKGANDDKKKMGTDWRRGRHGVCFTSTNRSRFHPDRWI